MKDFFYSDSNLMPSFDFRKYTKPIKAHILRNIILRRIGKRELKMQVKATPATEIALKEPTIELLPKTP